MTQVVKPGAGFRRVLYVAIAGDVAIAAAKFFVAALPGSSAMLTEGVHSLVDTGNELLLLYGVRRGQRAVDEWHPFGYGKISGVPPSAIWTCSYTRCSLRTPPR